MKLAALLTKFRPFDDRESEMAFFQTKVPWVAPEAYLNIIFKPAPADALKVAARALEMPQGLCDLLKIQNGAILFAGTLSIYGVHRPGQLLNRSDRFSLPPFNIHDHQPDFDSDRLLAIGGYGVDGSRACLDRRSLRVELWPRDEPGLHPRITWETLDQWLLTEIGRLSMLFNEEGKLLVPKSETLPVRAGRPN